MTVGERIQQKRNQRKMQAERLAEVVGVAPATIYRYENGEIKDVPVSTLEKIGAALKTPPAYLAGWMEDLDPPERSSFIGKLRHYIDNVAKLNRKRVAENMGISEAKLSLLLSGKRKVSIEEYAKPCRVLAVKPARFLDEA